MRNQISRYLGISIAILLIVFTGCKEGEEVFDTIRANEQRGAILRTVNLISNELPIGVADAGFEVELEVQDQQNGDLLSNLDIYVGFNDNTVPDGGTDLDVAETMFSTIPASSFTTGEFGLPRTMVSIPLSELLSFTGVQESDLFGGDQFTIRFDLNLTDGRTFSNDDNSGTITGSYFSSPFLYTPTVICPVAEDQFVGMYMIEQLTPGNFGDVWGDIVVELSIGETSTQRVFTAVYLPQFGIGNAAADFAFDLVCESVEVPTGQAGGLTCGGDGIFLGPPTTIAKGTYDPFDDSVFTVTFSEDELVDCGGPAEVTMQLTKQ